ncbi:MAG: aldo/keto reductase [Peptococcaceae bacterium]|jgi:predicted aldo/keto reductase-like oxidoreductase|nr:aldo/keto reductase [Peptococcaceae bacterium]MDH7524742.1 aldo/keto reductase [Peptococcaceae bacterium]
MEYKFLGRTKLRVSLVGFGGIPIQRVSEKEAARVIQAAIDKGINFFDSARGYTDSENKIGLGIKGKRDGLVLATKTMVRSHDKMKDEIDRSLKALAVEYIDLYQCHNVRSREDIEKITAPGGALEALHKAREAGKIRFIGLSGHRPPVIMEAIKTGAFDTIQVPYNFIERQVEEELLPLARREQLGIIVMKPLAGGAFSRPDLALRFLLAADVSTIIPGMDSLEQVEQNAALAARPEPLEQPELEYLLKEAKEVGNRFCRRCDYCKPCPQGIDIATHFVLHSYYRRYGMPDWAKDRYRKLPVNAGACQDCGLCESRCPYSLPVREMLKEAHKDMG